MSDIHSESSIAFVRTEMLEAKDPPSSQIGVVKWVRENLFSSWLNSILTILSIVFIYVVLKALIPWVFGGVWDAGSLGECRSVLNAFGQGGHGHGAACWAVIEDRWLQLLFGFYPPAEYWRPITFVVLMFVALLPILYSDYVSSKLMIFTAIFPFLAVWLIWGGSFWVPIMTAFGFIVGYVAFQVVSRVSFGGLGVAAGVLASVLWWLVAQGMIDDALNRTIGAARYDEALATAQAELAAAPELIEQAEARRDAIADDISVAVEGRDEVLEQIALIRSGESQGDLDVLQDQLLAMQDQLSAMRDTFTIAVRAATSAGAAQSDARQSASALAALPDQEAELPELRAARDEALAALPNALRGIGTGEDLPEGTSDEDEDALSAYLSLEADIVNTELAVDTTYRRLALTGLEPVESRNIGGFLLAIIIGMAGIILSLPLGILLALGRQSDLFIINKSSVAFIEVMRGVPLIVWLVTASLLLNYFLPPGTSFDLTLRVIIMVTLFSSAYIAEVIRGGLAALPTGQYEGADSLGLNYWQSMRLIILPQALKISIPGIVSSFIGLFKDTTLVAFIGLLDPIGLSNAIRASSEWNGIYWELFIFIGACFWIFCFSMSRYSQWLERKLHTGHR